MSVFTYILSYKKNMPKRQTCLNSTNQSMFVRPIPLSKQDKTPPEAHLSRDINGPNQVAISHEISHLIYQSEHFTRSLAAGGATSATIPLASVITLTATADLSMSDAPHTSPSC